MADNYSSAVGQYLLKQGMDGSKASSDTMRNQAFNSQMQDDRITRPSMKQEDHPAHNMPDATQSYDGTELK